MHYAYTPIHMHYALCVYALMRICTYAIYAMHICTNAYMHIRYMHIRYMHYAYIRPIYALYTPYIRPIYALYTPYA